MGTALFTLTKTLPELAPAFEKGGSDFIGALGALFGLSSATNFRNFEPQPLAPFEIGPGGGDDGHGGGGDPHDPNNPAPSGSNPTKDIPWVDTGSTLLFIWQPFVELFRAWRADMCYWLLDAKNHSPSDSSILSVLVPKLVEQLKSDPVPACSKQALYKMLNGWYGYSTAITTEVSQGAYPDDVKQHLPALVKVINCLVDKLTKSPLTNTLAIR